MPYHGRLFGIPRAREGGGGEGGGLSLNDNMNLQGESKKVRVIGSSSYRELEALIAKSKGKIRLVFNVQ